MTDWITHADRVIRWHRFTRYARIVGNALGNVVIVWWMAHPIGGLVGMVGVVCWSAITLVELHRDLFPKSIVVNV